MSPCIALVTTTFLWPEAAEALSSRKMAGSSNTTDHRKSPYVLEIVYCDGELLKVRRSPPP